MGNVEWDQKAEDDGEGDRSERDRHIQRKYPRLWAILVAGRHAERRRREEEEKKRWRKERRA
jgi:hypothetical protein